MKEQKHKNYLNKISKEGFLALQNGNSSIALEKFEIILSNYPNNSKILNLASICHCNLNNLKKAEEYISMAVASNPREIGFRVNWGNILLQMKKYVEAEKVYKNALKINDESAELFYNLGIVYSTQHKYKEAINYYDKSLTINKSNKFAFNNLANAFKELGNYEKAKENFNKAIVVDSSFSEAKFNLGMIMLLTNPNKNAWEKYEFRKNINNKRKKQLDNLNIKKWDGSNLKNKCLIIYSEQAMGDNVLFARYIKFIKKENTRIIFYTTKTLEFLFHKMTEIDEIIFDLQGIHEVDFFISIMSLPYIFRLNKKFPKPYNFLYVSDEDNKYWKNKINQNKLYKIGLMWQGDSKYKDDYKRSIQLSKLDPILQIQGIEYISLQKDLGKEQIKKFKYQNQIVDFFGDIDVTPFKDTLAIINNLDLIICVDTGMGQIAATLGKETWVMVSYVPADFRWGIESSNTHWYENVKLFRQKKINNWDSVILSIKKLLRLNLNKKSMDSLK